MSNQLVQSSPPRDRETSIEFARSIGRRELADAVHQMFDTAQEHEPDFRFELLATTDLALRTVDLAIAEGWSNWTIATMLSWVPDARPWQLSILASIGSFTRWCPAADLVVALHSVRETLERRARALN